MKPWITLARAPGLEGQELLLQERDGSFVIRSGGRELMSSARHHSEEELSTVGLRDLRTKTPAVLIGGLGLGYTVRATLDAMPRGGRVVVAEISSAVVEWNRTLLKHLAKAPLDDPRVRCEVIDVAKLAAQSAGQFDVILLDVDNGPSAVSTPANQRLFEDTGIALMRAALKPGGVLVVWSAGSDAPFLKRLGRAGFDAREDRSAGRPGGGGTYVLFVARLPQPRGLKSGRRTS